MIRKKIAGSLNIVITIKFTILIGMKNVAGAKKLNVYKIKNAFTTLFNIFNIISPK